MKRPSSLVEVTAESHTAKEFGYAVVEFLDQFYSEKRLEMVAEEPPLLAGQFPEGPTADAYLAAVAVHLSRSLGEIPPAWTRGTSRFLRCPWFANPGAALRATLLLESPAAFRERNLFVSENALERA